MRSIVTIILALLYGLTSQASSFVKIGAHSNPDNNEGYGAVSYAYNIGAYEITNEEYCLFLNSVARSSDSHALFNNLMQQHFLGGIIRTSDTNGYHYACKPGYAHRPVVCTTWMNAVRYANWLHYNATNIEQNVPVENWVECTEGDSVCGAYDTRSVPTTRHKDARYWLPSRSEWEKAAYYDGKTWRYNYVSPRANCASPANGWSQPYPHLAEVGLSRGPNGTYDQCGNAAEWVEDYDKCRAWKYALGGSAIRTEYYAQLGVTEGDSPNKAITTCGFRVCQTVNSKLRREAPTLPHISSERGNCNTTPSITDPIGVIYVKVGDIGNPGDNVNQFHGSVYYEYAISRTELSNQEYCLFLNAVATKSDPFHLFHKEMQAGVTGGIERRRNGKTYQYVCKKGWANRPVTYLSYYDLARYANWLHFGCPIKGVSEMGTTEGDASRGAYNTTDFESVRSGHKAPYKSFGKRNRGAHFWIPSEDEWYKAAYYDPEKIGNRPYHDYPTRSSDAPTHEQANYMFDNTLCLGEPYFVAPVDSFQNPASYYGTLNQGGNVWEWIEDWQYGTVGCRGLRGGSWSYTEYGLNACNTDPGGIDDCIYVYGGRLCMSLSEEGWQPVCMPFVTRFHQKLFLISPKRFLLASGVMAATVLCLLTIVILIQYRKRK